jgi:hypothetical protein
MTGPALVSVFGSTDRQVEVAAVAALTSCNEMLLPLSISRGAVRIDGDRRCWAGATE